MRQNDLRVCYSPNNGLQIIIKDLIKFTKKSIIEILGSDLPIPTKEERNWIGGCFKRTIPAKICSYRSIRVLQQREQNASSSPHHRQLIDDYLFKIAKEIIDDSTEMIGLIDEILKRDLLDDEDRLYYCHLKGDYYKMLFSIGGEQDKWKLLYCQSFEDGRDSLEKVSPLNVIGLRTSLAASVFYYEVMNDQEKAVEIAKSAFNAAVPLFDELDEEVTSEILMLLQILRDNLTLWTFSEEPDEED